MCKSVTDLHLQIFAIVVIMVSEFVTVSSDGELSLAIIYAKYDALAFEKFLKIARCVKGF